MVKYVILIRAFYERRYFHTISNLFTLLSINLSVLMTIVCIFIIDDYDSFGLSNSPISPLEQILKKQPALGGRKSKHKLLG